MPTQTPIQMLAGAMTGHSNQQLIEIIRELETRNMTTEERMIRIAAHEVIEQRHPEIAAILESRIDEDIPYTDLVVDVLRNLNHIN